MSVVVRFAPSPTGYLHIGGARTALFNWLYAKHNNGKFLIRIEDTDRARSTNEAIDSIFESLRWLGLDWDGDPIFQFSRAGRHAEVAEQLVKEGNAYYCYCSIKELEEMKEEARKSGNPPRYDGLWRNKSPNNAPEGVAPVIRFKAPQTGKTKILDLVQGEVELDNAQLDDMILLRADGTPTYMLSVVVDDHDMGITHIIRGDDHLTNAFRQYHLYKALNWGVPEFAHIPLIHGPDGTKLSKRHGALGAEQYKNMGFLPEAMRNYLLRLGWAHGNDEVISTAQAIEWFDVSAIGRSPARLDLEKLSNINGLYIRQAEPKRLVEDIKPIITKKYQDLCAEKNIKPDENDLKIGLQRIMSGMDGLKERAKTLIELAENAMFYLLIPVMKQFYAESNWKEFINDFSDLISESDCQKNSIEEKTRGLCKQKNIKLGEFMKPIRLALTGSDISPSLFEIAEILGREESLCRLKTFCFSGNLC